MFYSEVEDSLTARRLVLSLLNVAGRRPEPIAHLIAAGRLFDIEAGSMRMAVGRLTKEGLLVSEARGQYAIGPRAEALRTQIRSWESALQDTKPWAGDWLVVHTAHLGRTDRKQLRSRLRALKLSGFAESRSGLWVRPANLIATLDETRSRLTSIGLDDGALILLVTHVSREGAFEPQELWPTHDLEPLYRQAIEAMSDSSTRIASLPTSQAAKETLLVGQTVLQLINLDPLLPQEIVDRSLLEKMIGDMRVYNKLGRSCWRAFYTEIDRRRPT